MSRRPPKETQGIDSAADLGLVPDALQQAAVHKHNRNLGFRMSVWANFFNGPLFAEVEKRSGLLRDEFTVLGHLRDYGSMLATSIALITGRPKNSISRAVNSLIARGSISRKLNPKDRREAILTLEPAGRELFETVWPLCIGREHQMFQVLDAAELETLDRLLEKLIRSYLEQSTRYALSVPSTPRI